MIAPSSFVDVKQKSGFTHLQSQLTQLCLHQVPPRYKQLLRTRLDVITAADYLATTHSL